MCQIGKQFFLYRSFVSIIEISTNIKQKPKLQLIQANQNYRKSETSKCSKVQFIKKNELKIIYKIIFVTKHCFRSALQERCSANMKQKREKQCRSAISTKPLNNFIEITPKRGCVPENSQYVCRTPSSRRTPL